MSRVIRVFLRTIAVSFGIVAVALAAEGSKATLTDASQRSSPPALRLHDSTGKLVDIADFHGKVALLDFWATWCHGCKEELPWFAEDEASLGNKGFTVVAVSMDEDGWPVVTPFVKTHRMPVNVLLDDGSSTKRFNIEAMPLALLIDRKGRVAARYVGVVDRQNLEQNIEALLNEH